MSDRRESSVAHTEARLEEIDLETLPDPDGSTFWHPDYFEPFADKAPYPPRAVDE